METANPTTMRLESVRVGELGADAMYGPGGCENCVLRLESHVPEKQFVKIGHAAHSKPWKEMLGMRHWRKSSSSKSMSDPRIPKTGRRCRWSGCAGIFRVSQRSDDARNSRCPESISMTSGKKKRSEIGTDDCTLLCHLFCEFFYLVFSKIRRLSLLATVQLEEKAASSCAACL